MPAVQPRPTTVDAPIGPLPLCRFTLDTPIGPMLALASEAALCALEFSSPDRLSRLEARLDRWFAPYRIEDRTNGAIDRAREWLRLYFGGASADAGELALDLRGRSFERRVWAALTAIPPGDTTTYGTVARRVGPTGGSRAVGLANGANPIAIVIPCHRVIGSNGELTGYGGGLDRKRWLLDHERRWRGEFALRP
jgi:methylated-DNA-[protein]-cysteine S-methyltransferase